MTREVGYLVLPRLPVKIDLCSGRWAYDLIRKEQKKIVKLFRVSRVV